MKARLTFDQNLLRAGPEPESIQDVSGAPVAPQRFFDIGPVGADDPRGLEPTNLVMSADWEEHGSCGGMEGALVRAGLRGKGDTRVYRARVEAVETPLQCNGRSVATEAWHWPESANEAHSHIVLPSWSKNAERRAVRKALQLAFQVVTSAAQ